MGRSFAFHNLSSAALADDVLGKVFDRPVLLERHFVVADNAPGSDLNGVLDAVDEELDLAILLTFSSAFDVSFLDADLVTPEFELVNVAASVRVLLSPLLGHRLPRFLG